MNYFFVKMFYVTYNGFIIILNELKYFLMFLNFHVKYNKY